MYCFFQILLTLIIYCKLSDRIKRSLHKWILVVNVTLSALLLMQSNIIVASKCITSLTKQHKL